MVWNKIRAAFGRLWRPRRRTAEHGFQDQGEARRYRDQQIGEAARATSLRPARRLCETGTTFLLRRAASHHVAGDAPPARQALAPGKRPAPQHHLDPPGARRGRWAQGPGTLGRRPGARQAPLGRADPGRADQRIGRVGGPACWLAGRAGSPGPDRGHESAPEAAASLVDLGPGQGDG